MSSRNIVLSTPHDYDLQGLAEATRQSLVLLKPWTMLPPSSSNPLVGEIVEKAGKYVSAVQMGVSAAYSGFTVTEEVLFLASALPVEDHDDLKHYLEGMMDLAREARENANNAFQAFRDVRADIFSTMSKLTEQLKNSQHSGQTSNNFPPYSKEELDVLVKFSEYLSKYADWWDWIKVETDPSPSINGQPLAFQLDSLKDPEALKRWAYLRRQYTSYVQMIGELEDSDPEFFSRSPSPSPAHDGQSSSSQAMTQGNMSLSLSGTPLPQNRHTYTSTVPSHPPEKDTKSQSQSPPTSINSHNGSTDNDINGVKSHISSPPSGKKSLYHTFLQCLGEGGHRVQHILKRISGAGRQLKKKKHPILPAALEKDQKIKSP